MRSLLCSLLVAGTVLCGCANYTQDLNRAERHFKANDYERALASFRLLESDLDSLSPMDRARYAYLRGMTAHRMSLREDARHWLAIARAIDKTTPGGLQASWKERMKDALDELDGNRQSDSDSIATEGPAFAPPGL